MNMLSRRRVLRSIGSSVALAAALTCLPALARDRTSVKIGYAVSKTGPNAGGANITTTPNYVLWVKEVNEAGGLELPDGARLPIEVIEYDDRSSAEEVVRAIERLANQDQVDFILPPWGTGLATSALRAAGVRIPEEMAQQLRYGRALDNRRLKAAGYTLRYTTREAVSRFAEDLRVRALRQDGSAPYRYEREVEEFLRYSPSVRRRSEQTPGAGSAN